MFSRTPAKKRLGRKIPVRVKIGAALSAGLFVVVLGAATSEPFEHDIADLWSKPETRFQASIRCGAMFAEHASVQSLTVSDEMKDQNRQKWMLFLKLAFQLKAKEVGENAARKLPIDQDMIKIFERYVGLRELRAAEPGSAASVQYEADFQTCGQIQQETLT